MWLVKRPQNRDFRIRVGWRHHSSLFYTVAVIAVGCRDSLDLSVAHIKVHLVVHVTKMWTISISAFWLSGRWRRLLATETSTCWVDGGVKRKTKCESKKWFKIPLVCDSEAMSLRLLLTTFPGSPQSLSECCLRKIWCGEGHDYTAFIRKPRGRQSVLRHRKRFLNVSGITRVSFLALSVFFNLT